MKQTNRINKPTTSPPPMLRQRRRQQPERPVKEVEIFPSEATSSCTTWWAWPLHAPPSNALTDNEEEIWNAGQFAPAGIRFEFAAPVRCTRIDLLPCMSPEAGTVVHEIRAGSDVYRYAGRATDRRWINADMNPDGQRVKSIEIVTLESPSWVAWRRVRFWSTVA